MANWCMNTLTVTGMAADVARFEAANTKDGVLLSFAALVPLPQDAHGEALHGDAFISAALRAWGTKWDNTADDDDVTVARAMLGEGTARTTYTFQSAWMPPKAWLAAVAPRFKTLCFELAYNEPGNRLKGTMRRAARGRRASTAMLIRDTVAPDNAGKTPADPAVQALIAVAARTVRFFRKAPITELELVETALGVNAPLAALEAALAAVGVREVPSLDDDGPLNPNAAQQARDRYSALLDELVSDHAANNSHE